jgi:hypothetical protein
MKVWIVNAIWKNPRDVDYGESNTHLIEILLHEPSQDEAERLVAKKYHNKAECLIDRECDVEIRLCRWCSPPDSLTEFHVDDEFGMVDDLNGWGVIVVESEVSEE